MTFSEDFAPLEGDQDLELEPSYPVAFGIELTPKVQGIALALVGIVGAFFLYQRLVQPVAQTKQDAEQRIADKIAQLEAQQASIENVEAIKAELDEAIQQRVGIYSLLGDADSLDTLLLDINQQIKASNAGIDDAIAAGDLTTFAENLTLLGVPANIVDSLLKEIYSAELYSFDPVGSSGLVTDDSYGPELNGKLERQVVNVSFQSLFSPAQSILRNIERLEPLVVINGFNQTWAPYRGDQGDFEENLRRLGVARPLNTTFNLEVLVPVGDPTQVPPPPPPIPVEGEVPAEGGEAPPAEEG
jgi:type IV pilus assembly protein PilO